MTPRFLIDTSCMVAMLCAWHEHHERAHRAIERRLDRGEALVVAAHGLIETYAVLTRLAPPHRLSPVASTQLLTVNFMNEDVEVLALSTEGYGLLLREAPGRAIAGGIIYDALILECALAADAQALVTFNQRQFERIAAGRIEIAVP